MKIVLEKLVRVKNIPEVERDKYKLFDVSGYAIKQIEENSPYSYSYKPLPDGVSASQWLLDQIYKVE